jgi:E3 ubiquitin-protein ligase CCNP1IP1
MQVDQNNLRRKAQDTIQALQEKTRKYLQTQELYDKLKRRTMLGQVQHAAHDAVDHTIQESVNANRFFDGTGEMNQCPPPSSLFKEINNGGSKQSDGAQTGSEVMQHHDGGNRMEGSWARFSSQGNFQRMVIYSSILCCD